jgi:hypothetical protein
VTIEQVYQNTEEDALEVKYLFPLDSNSAVAKFEAVFGTTTIHGIIKEKEMAKLEYVTAVRSGRQAALMEQDQDKPDVFTCSIGNLRPNEQCTVRFTYVTEVRIDNGKARFFLPTVVAPAYVVHNTPPAWPACLPAYHLSFVSLLLQLVSCCYTDTQ